MVLCVLSSFVIISLGKRELIALHLVCSECYVGVIFLRTLFCFAVLCVLSSFVIISLGKRELVALHLVCSECHVGVTFFDSSSRCYGLVCSV